MPFALAACALYATAGCRETSRSTREPDPTPLRAHVLPSETATPTPTITLTPSITPQPSPTATAVFGAADTGATAPPGCEILLNAARWVLTPDEGASTEAEEAWRSESTRELVARVLYHEPPSHKYVLKAVDPPSDQLLRLTYSHDAPPLSDGREYRFKSHQDVPGQAPLGSALRIDDDQGLLFFGLSARETEGAAERLLGGDRAGLIIRQQPTTCLYAPVNECGYELRSAPLGIERGDDSMTLVAGKMDTLRGDPPYQITVYTSHYRLWVQNLVCQDQTAWPLSYQLVRVSE